jgi:hypothetical protein
LNAANAIKQSKNFCNPKTLGNLLRQQEGINSNQQKLLQKRTGIRVFSFFLNNNASISVDRIIRISASSGASGTVIDVGICELVGVGDAVGVDVGFGSGERV